MSRVLVTGAAGFIGSTLARHLVDAGQTVVASDELGEDERWRNLEHARVADFVPAGELVQLVADGELGPLDVVYHLGANSDTTARDGGDVLRRNYQFSRQLLAASARHRTRFVYASSASVYGLTGRACERIEHEAPLNLYAFSKLLFDRYVRSNVLGQFPMPVVGLRYFNVYGEREVCKGRMASVIHHFVAQVADGGVVRLFDGSGGYGPGEQRRDFICVDDVVAVTRHFGEVDDPPSGIYNVGTGAARPFNDIARLVVETIGGTIEYVPFPGDLAGKYQHFTEADLTGLHAAGFPRDHPFVSLEVGVPRVVRYLQSLRPEVVP